MKEGSTMTPFTKHIISLRIRFKRGKPQSAAVQFGRDPRTDWRIACLAFLILALLAVALNLLVYDKVSRGEIFRSDEKRPAPPRTLNRFELEQTVLFYKKRHERFEALMRTPLSASDPFIPAVLPKTE